MAIILKTEGLTKEYQNGEKKTEVLKGIDLKVEDNSFCAITGRSGSGKSTLLHVASGLLTPTSGKAAIGGEDILNLKEEERCRLRRDKIGFVFQSYNLLPEFSVEENIKMPLFLAGRKPDEEYLKEIMGSLGLYKLRKKFPSQLSGGEKQRTAIARALANKPQIIFADEPTGNLDKRTGEEVMELLLHCRKKFGQTLLLVTHDMDIAGRAERILVMEDGRIKE